MSNSKKRITLGVATLGCLLLATATASLNAEAPASYATVTPVSMPSPLERDDSLPQAAKERTSRREAQARDLTVSEPAPRIEAATKTEELSYSYKITQEEERSTLETSGVLTLTLKESTERERRAEARLLSVVAWRSEGVDTVFLSEVMASTADVTLSPVGAITGIKLPDGLSSEASRYWKRVLGRWQTAGPAKPDYAERWRATERNELGTYSALYELDLEAGDGTISKVILGYKSLDDANATGHPMCESEARLTPGEHPSKIEGRDLLSAGPGSFGPEELITYSFTRMR